MDEPELHLSGDALVPDLGGWRRERMPVLPEVPAFELAPDWVCEVLSPSTAPLDRTRKLPIYAHERVGHVWFVDPAPKLRQLMVDFYDKLDSETRALVPLRRFYWPVVNVAT